MYLKCPSLPPAPAAELMGPVECLLNWCWFIPTQGGLLSGRQDGTQQFLLVAMYTEVVHIHCNVCTFIY